MSEVIQQLGQKIAEQSVTQEQTLETQSPDEETVAKFERAMEEGQPATSQLDETGVSQVGNVSSSSEAQSLGDQILRGIEKLRQKHEAQTERVNALLENKKEEPLSVQDALRLQFELVQLNFQQDLVSKGADKSSQAIQSMLRNQ